MSNVVKYEKASMLAKKVRGDEVHSLMDGSIYVLSNRMMPGVYKIGVTSRSIDKRIRELSASTSVPAPFDLVFKTSVFNSRAVESAVHSELAEHRVNVSREFFSADPDAIVSEIARQAEKALSMAIGGDIPDSTYLEWEDDKDCFIAVTHPFRKSRAKADGCSHLWSANIEGKPFEPTYSYTGRSES